MQHRFAALSLFAIEKKEFEHLVLSDSDYTMLTLLVYGICIGMALAAVYMFYQRSVPGAFARALLAANARDRETALTAAELGFGKNRLVAYALKHDTMLFKAVEKVEEAQAPTRYFIPEEKCFLAENRYQKKGNGPITLLLICIACFGLALALLKLFPFLLSMIDAVL